LPLNYGTAIYDDPDSYYSSSVPTNLTTFTKLELFGGTHDETVVLARELNESEILLLLNDSNPQTWGFDTCFLASYDETLEAGSLKFGDIAVDKWRLKRQNSVNLQITTVKDFNIDDYDMQIIFTDRGLWSNRNYLYFIMPVGVDGTEGSVLSVPTGITFEGMFLVDPDDENKNVHFFYDLQPTSTEYIEDRVELRTFSSYPFIRKGQGSFERGSINASFVTDEYGTATSKYQMLKTLIKMDKPLLLKDGRGFNYLVNAYEPKEQAERFTYDYTHAQINWVEVGEAPL
jgi:hypothetical protein